MQQSLDHTSPPVPSAPGTGHISAEEILRLFAHSPIAIGLVKGPDFVISAGNDAMFSIWGLSGEVLGQKLADVLPRLVKDGFIDIIRSVFQTGIAYSDYEYQLYQQRNDNIQETYYTFNYTPSLDEDGRVSGVIVTGVEVTPRAILNKRVAESEAHYRRLIENLPVAMYACDKDGYITQFNKAAENLFGREIVAGRERWTAAWKMAGEDGQYIPPSKSPMAIALQTGLIPPPQEITLQNPDGSVRVVIDHPQLFFQENGEITGGLNAIIDITERKLAEKSTASLAAIVHSTNDAIISKNLKGIITSWNPAAERLFGYTEEEMVGTPITRLFPAERLSEEPVLIDRITRGERVEHFDTVRIKKNGEPIDISLTISPIKDINGRIIGASKIARDITAQKALFTALQESEHKFRELVMQAPVGITILRGKEMIVELANDTYLKIIDKTKDEFIGKSLYASLPEVRSAVEPLLNNVLATGIPYYGSEFKVNLRRYNRVDTSYFNFVYQPLHNHDGSTSRIVVVVNEITEQVEAKHALAESEREFKRMVLESPIAMTIFRGPEFIIEMANTEMLSHIWRRKEREVIGKKALEVFPELKEQKYPDLIRKVMQTGQLHRENESVAYIHGATEMKKFYLDFELAPLYGTDGNISGVMITFNDVTEKVEARQKVEDAEARLRLAAEGTGLATWDLNLINQDIIYTPRLAEIFGLDPSEQLSFSRFRERFIPEDLRNIVSPAFRTAMETGVYFYEARVIWPDNSVHWVRTHGTVIYDQQRKPLRMLGTAQDATEQKNASRVLEESEQRLNIALEATELGTWELNLKTKQPRYSARYLQILGFKPEEQPAHPDLLKRIHPEDRPRRDQAMTEALKTGRLDIELRVSRSETDIRWVRARGKLFHNGEGEAQRMMGTLQDITDQKMAFISLQESEERFKIVADSAPVMIWMSGSDKFVDFFNTTWLNFTGRPLEEEMCNGWQEDVHPDDLARILSAYEDAFAKQTSFYTEYRLRRHDGVFRWISDNAVPRYANGKFIGFISACMDIDDEKKFNERLQQSELLFKTISNVSPVGLWMVNEKGENTFVNDTWIKWTGLSLSERYEHGWFQTLLEADRETVQHIFHRKFEQREKFAAEYRFKRADGAVRWAFSEGYPFYDQAGNFAGYAGSVSDITERKQDEIRKNEFLAVASHELKTPITSIKAYTQLLANTYQHTDDAFLKNALAKVENQISKMSKLVGDFLNLSKIEAGKVVLQQERFCLKELVQEAIADIQLVAPGYLFNLKAPAERLFVEADREKIMQVLANLLNNAVKYSTDEKEVAVTVEKEANHILVRIDDRGIGIKPGEYEKIFERFYRADPNNIRVSGFGIGLYISAEIIRRHGGQIGATGRKGKGSSFYFRLPVAEK